MPFATFVAFLAVEPWLAGWLETVGDGRWAYGLRAVLVAGMLLLWWRHYGELASVQRPANSELLLAAAVGLSVLVIWLALDGSIFTLGKPSGFDPSMPDGSLDWPLALMRLAGAALVVPVMEELFWRSLVLRWLEGPEFAAVDPALVGMRALLLSSLAFGFEHSQWAAGIAAGLAYGWLYRRCGNLWIAVLAHAVTNAGLGAWVLANGAWQYW